MPKLKTLEDLFKEQLKDLYYAEKHLTKALPKMSKKASSEELKTAIDEHLKETENQVKRLEKVFKSIGMEPKTKKCPAMDGLIEEGKEMMQEEAEPSVMDAGLIAAAQKVEHYEIASYGCLKTYANMLGYEEAAELLEETLDEEKNADSKLSEIAESFVNEQAVAGEEAEEE